MSRSSAPRPARRRAIALNPTQKSQLAAAQALDEALHDTGFAAQSVEVKGQCAACRAKSGAQPPA